MQIITGIASDKLHQLLTLKAGLIHFKASLTWCDEAISLLENKQN